MMKGNHTAYEIRLLPYVYETLTARECRDLEGHIRRCLRCQRVIERLVNLKKRMEREPKPAVQGLWIGVAEAVRRASRRDGRRSAGQTAVETGLKMRWVRVLAPVAAGMAAAVAAAVLVTARISGTQRLTFVKVTGEVTVNSRPFFRDIRTDYPISGTLRLGTGNGECVLQLAREGLLVVSEKTEVTLENRGAIVLKKGLIVVRIDRAGQKTDFRVRTPKGEFTAKNAVFYVRTDGDAVECGVKEGKLQTVVGKRLYEVAERERVRIGGGADAGVTRSDLGQDGDVFFGRLNRETWERPL